MPTLHRSIAIAGLWFGLAQPGAAALFTVTSTEDAPDAVPGDGACAAAGGACTLRAAVMEANEVAGDDTIALSAGEYVLSLAGDGPEGGDLDVSSVIAIEGAGSADTAIDGAGQDRVLEVATAEARLELRDVTVRNGSVGRLGGAMQAAGAVLLADCVFEGNTANAGGAIAALGSLTAERCTFRDNQTAPLGFTNEQGGALYLRGPTILDSCTLSGNRALLAGAAIFAEGSSADVELINTTISDNLAGDAVYLQNTGGELTHVTIAANEGRGLATFSFGSVHAVSIANTAIADNAGGGCSFPASNGPVVTRSGNNFASDASCGFTAPGSIENGSAQLGPLADNGGPTATRLPLARSPLRDAAAAGPCEAFDQRGVVRPQDGDGDGSAACDIGAVEAPEAGAGAAALAAASALAAVARARRRQP